MAHVTEPNAGTWTVADLAERFGPIPLSRIRHDPPPGTARESDVIEIHDREDRLCELIDGVLMEKTVGIYESYLAMKLARLLANYVEENDLGIMLGADGPLRLALGLVRIPDVSFVSWQRLPDREVPRDAIPDLVPDLAVEVISKGNTRKEMERKLQDYFSAGVRQVWYVYPDPREVRVYTAPEQFVSLDEQQTLHAGDVLPGFRLPLKELFAKPGQAGRA